MIKIISTEAWGQYKALLPPTRKIYEPALPANLPYQGRLQGDFDYVLPEEVLGPLRVWLANRGEASVYYFLTETTGEEPSDFEVQSPELTSDNLAKINRSYENAIVGRDFGWAIFVDHEGAVHVSGPHDLMFVLSQR